MSERPRLEKRLSYRDLSGRSQAAHAAHWRGFTFSGGPWMVRLVGPWGAPQVWASTPAEGRRVLMHVAQIAGYDLETADYEWWESEVKDPRYGRTATFRLQIKRGVEQISKRDGPSGAPDESIAP